MSIELPCNGETEIEKRIERIKEERRERENFISAVSKATSFQVAVAMTV
jgi:hypothetical protein